MPSAAPTAVPGYQAFVRPGVILGYRADGRPIRLMGGGSVDTTGAAGGSGDGSDGGDAGDASQGQQQNNGQDRQSTGVTQEDLDRALGALERERQQSRAGKAAIAELAKVKQSQQTDQEKAISAAVEEATKTLRTEYGRDLTRAELVAAAGKGFQNPQDAADLLSARYDEFLGDDGKPDKAKVKTAVDALLKERPYLGTAPAPADLDAGRRNGRTGTTDMNRVIRQAAGR